MSLISLEFMLFVTIVVIIYYRLTQRFQWKFLLLLSVLFYMSFDVKMTGYIIASVVVNYIASNRIESLSSSQEKKKRKQIVRLALISNFSILGVVKYTDFILGNIGGLFSLVGFENGDLAVRMLIPVGISFYTFQATGYLLDVYWKKQPAEKNIWKLALFTCYFPQIIQGPISKYGQLSSQFEKRHDLNYEKLCFSLQLILWGYFKKMVIADNAAVAVKSVFGNPEHTYGISVIIGVLCYCIQLYADFSGGIDVIRGVSALFDIELVDNFRQPFFSKSISEFWRRWHITLGTWMKDYVFYPFSLSKVANRIGKKSRERFGKVIGRKIPICLANLLVFFLVGIWHGASWHFIVYGIYNGLIIAISSLLEPVYEKMFRVTKIDKNKLGYQIFQVVRTFLLVNIGWYFDNARNLEESFLLMKNTFHYSEIQFVNGTYLGLSIYQYLIIIAGCIVLFAVEYIKEKGMSVRKRIQDMPLVCRWAIWIVLLYAIPILGHYSQGAGGFMYAQF